MSQDDKEQLYRNLVMLLKMFKNRPYHLAKYLIDNSSLNQNFIKKILESDKLKDMLKEEEESNVNLAIIPMHFNDINQMSDYFGAIMDDMKLLQEKTVEELTKDMNDKLNKCIKSENYEDAARIRDYMQRNGIKRINF